MTPAYFQGKMHHIKTTRQVTEVALARHPARWLGGTCKLPREQIGTLSVTGFYACSYAANSDAAPVGVFLLLTEWRQSGKMRSVENVHCVSEEPVKGWFRGFPDRSYMPANRPVFHGLLLFSSHDATIHTITHAAARGPCLRRGWRARGLAIRSKCCWLSRAVSLVVAGISPTPYPHVAFDETHRVRERCKTVTSGRKSPGSGLQIAAIPKRWESLRSPHQPSVYETLQSQRFSKTIRCSSD